MQKSTNKCWYSFSQRYFTELVTNLASNTINKFERKIRGKGNVRVKKGLTLFILNEDMNDIIKTIKS